MYNPYWFKEDRTDVLLAEVERISFGTIVTNSSSGLRASHVPMLIDRSTGELGTLFGHVARGNSQWRDSTPGGDGLAIFLGPEAYISPSWYQTRKETAKVVPTWNYIAVHVRGPVTFFEDAERILRIVTELTRHHEADSEKPWKVTDAPAEYISGELKSIVGFEMPIAKIEGKWKLSQNRPEADREGVKSNLLERGRLNDPELAEEMQKKDESLKRADSI